MFDARTGERLSVKVPLFRLKLMLVLAGGGKDARACSTADRRRIGHLAPDSKAWHHVLCHTYHLNPRTAVQQKPGVHSPLEAWNSGQVDPSRRSTCGFDWPLS